MKAEGLVAGVPDVILCIPTILAPVTFIEFKKPKGVQSDAQKQIQKLIEWQGCRYFLLRSVDEAIAVTKHVIKNRLK